MIKKLIILFLFTSIFLAQEANIVPYLKSIEEGEINTAKEGLNTLKKNNPNDPSVIFLDAVLTEEGEAALKKYQTIYEQHPKSNYADASLYRVFSYYFSLGVYQRAEELHNKLKTDYPSSPYIRAADRSIPDQADIVKSEPAAIPQKQITEEPTGSYNFTIQAGAFLNLENAQNLADEIKKDGYPVELGTKSVGGSLLNIVTFGRLQNETEADPLLSYLKNKFDLNGRVITVE